MLKAIFEATTDKKTPVNIVQHSYFNLAGHDSGSALDHILYINGCVTLSSSSQAPQEVPEQFIEQLINLFVNSNSISAMLGAIPLKIAH